MSASSPERIAPKRERRFAAIARPSALDEATGNVPGPRRLRALFGPTRVTLSPGWSAIFAVSGRAFPGG